MRRMISLTILMLLFGMVGFAQAQTNMPVVCGDLSDADCDILTQNQQAMHDLQSYAYSLNADFTLANIPDMPNNVTFGLTGSGAVTGNNASLMQSPDDVMAMMSDPEAYADFISSALDAVDMELSLVLNLPAELVEQSGGEMPSTIPLDVVLADGIGYLNFNTLRDAVGEAGASFPEGWYGIDLAGLVEQMMAMSGAMGSMDSMQMMDPSMMAQFTDPEFLNDFTRVERLDDTTAADGTGVASFHVIIDYQALMSSPAMQDLIAQSIAAQGEELSEAELEQIQTMMPQMFQGVTLDIFQTIGLEDYYTRSTQVTMNFDMQSLMAMSESEDMEGPAPVLMMNINVTQSDFNEVGEITAPDGATVIPLESLGMMGALEADGVTSPDFEGMDEATEMPMMAEPTPTTAG